jgi:hypothetical protein
VSIRFTYNELQLQLKWELHSTPADHANVGDHKLVTKLNNVGNYIDNYIHSRNEVSKNYCVAAKHYCVIIIMYNKGAFKIILTFIILNCLFIINKKKITIKKEKYDNRKPKS